MESYMEERLKISHILGDFILSHVCITAIQKLL